MTDARLDVVAAFLEQLIGLRLEPARRARLARVARVTLGEDLDIGRLRSEPGLADALVDAMTVGETRFLRDAATFAAIAALIRADRRPLVVWCAGCAGGQEAYSVAALCVLAGHPDWHVLASDVAPGAVARARAGRYGDREIADLPEAHRAALLRPDEGGGWRVRPDVAARMSVVRHNLVTQRPPLEPGSARLVLCRNVLIYFSGGALAAAEDALDAGCPEEAAARLREAAYLEPRHPLPPLLLGLARESLGDPEGALRAWATAWWALERHGGDSRDSIGARFSAGEARALLESKLRGERAAGRP